MIKSKYAKSNLGIAKKRRLLIKSAWATPLVASVTLPAHAQSTPVSTVQPTTIPLQCTIDLSPTITITPNDFTGPTSITIDVTVNDVNGCETDGSDIFVLIPISNFMDNVVLTPATGWVGITFGTDWAFGLRGGAVFPANGSVTHRITATFNPGIASGQENIVATIFDGSGGDTNIPNNRDQASILYAPL